MRAALAVGDQHRQEALHEPEVDCCHFGDRRGAGVCVQAQPPSTAKVTKADAQNVLKIISSDKAKTPDLLR